MGCTFKHLGAAILLIALCIAPSFALAHTGHEHGGSGATAPMAGAEPRALPQALGAPSQAVQVDAVQGYAVQEDARQELSAAGQAQAPRTGCAGHCCSALFACCSAVALPCIWATSPPLDAITIQWPDPSAPREIVPDGPRKPPRLFA